MYGALAGDIAGSIYEFNNIKTKEFNLYVEPRLRFTDDSVMTIAVAKSLWDTMEDNYEGLNESLIKNMHEIGKRYPYCGYGNRFYNWIMFDGTKPYYSYGNGSAMRVSECGWVGNSLNEVLKLADITASVTHNHPEGIKGAQAIAACIYLARNDWTKEDIRKYVEENFYDMDFKLDDIRNSYKFEVSCQKSVPQAIESFLESFSFDDALKNAISIGGDSDTLAAMAGSIAEAYYGVPDRVKLFVNSRLDKYLLDIIKRRVNDEQ